MSIATAVPRGRAVAAVAHWTTELPVVSFIIPVLNEAAGIEPLLRELGSRFPDCERVVVDGGSSDGTVALASPLCEQLIESEAGRARQMNRGAAAACGDYYLFLHADSFPGVSSEQLQSILKRKPAWGFCRVKLDGDEWMFALISWFMNVRSRLTHVATGDQMHFVSSDTFLQTGGFPDIPLMEDVAYSKRLRKTSRPVIVNQPAVTSSRRWRETGVIRTIVTMWTLRLAYVLGVPPRRLAQIYYGG